ncbi:DsbA family protein [Streptomyces griseorubiginosus]|uniref:DsbA family oxidoreductase n=1 Tax=Streptomyces griseorubiginosus TaxID=67304 RepID=UPI00114047C0|nr:DsbA family protein [Streptomyces griseorubiginosus]
MTSQPGTDRATVEVVEYTDPLCPWSWGAEPVLRGLRATFAGRVRWRRVFCILFDHDDDPAPDAAAEIRWYSRYVEDIARHTQAPRAFDLSRVAASSWPASLVAKAAEAQGAEVAERVLRRLRESVFVLGEPADTPALARSVVRGVPGLDLERLAADASSAAVLDQVRADHAEARSPVREVLSVRDDGSSPHPGVPKETPDGGRRYALPTLLVRSAPGVRVVPGWRSYDTYASAIGSQAGVPATAPVRLAPAEALARYGSLTEPERRLLTHGAWPPADAVRVDTAGGPLWLHPEEARAHPAVGRGAPAAP